MRPQLRGETFILGPGVVLGRARDIDAKDSGQGGVQIKFRAVDSEYGFYAAQFHDKMPQFYTRPAGGDYRAVYAEDIHLVRASFSSLVGETNVAGELSTRDNMTLVARAGFVVLPDLRLPARRRK